MLLGREYGGIHTVTRLSIIRAAVHHRLRVDGSVKVVSTCDVSTILRQIDSIRSHGFDEEQFYLQTAMPYDFLPE
jgi:hypothetical protein